MNELDKHLSSFYYKMLIVYLVIKEFYAHIPLYIHVEL